MRALKGRHLEFKKRAQQNPPNRYWTVRPRCKNMTSWKNRGKVSNDVFALPLSSPKLFVADTSVTEVDIQPSILKTDDFQTRLSFGINLKNWIFVFQHFDHWGPFHVHDRTPSRGEWRTISSKPRDRTHLDVIVILKPILYVTQKLEDIQPIETRIQKCVHAFERSLIGIRTHNI